MENHEVSHNMCNVSASETKHNRIYSEINLTTEIIIHSTNYYNYYCNAEVKKVEKENKIEKEIYNQKNIEKQMKNIFQEIEFINTKEESIMNLCYWY